MTEEILRAVGNKILRSELVSRNLSVLWHAGEPLVLPPKYYRKAFDLLNAAAAPSVSLTHKIQTNGMLLSEEWCRLLKEYNVVVGISLDGPAYLHDLHRKTRSGLGTFARVVAGIKLLQDHGIPFHTITVLTKAALDQAEEMFEVFETLRPERVSFNVEEVEGLHSATSLRFAGVEAKYRQFFESYWDLIQRSNSHQRVREIHNTIAYVLNHGPGGLENDVVRPLSCVSVDYAGNLSTFSPELLSAKHPRQGEFAFGNVLTSSLEEMTLSEKFNSVAEAIKAGVEKCQSSCEYFSVCGGGSPSNKLWENDDFASTETLYCRLTVKTLTDLVLSRLRNDATVSAMTGF